MRLGRLNLDFAPAARVHSPTSTMLLASGALALASIGYPFGQTWWAQSEAARKVVEVQAESAGLAADEKRPRLVGANEQAQQRMNRRVQHELLAPWAGLLGALDDATDESVALLVAVPESSNRSVRLTVEARDLDAMLKYLGSLQSDRRLSQVILLSHQIQTADPGAPVRFQIQAVWGQPS